MIGLGWQLAIIYLAVTSPDRRQLDDKQTTGVALPPISLLTRTVASRARSLGLDERGPGADWARAMEALVAGASLDADDTSRLASELHLGLVESLSSADNRLRPAYELGRLLSETVVIATGAPPERCARIRLPPAVRSVHCCRSPTGSRSSRRRCPLAPDMRSSRACSVGPDGWSRRTIPSFSGAPRCSANRGGSGGISSSIARAPSHSESFRTLVLSPGGGSIETPTSPADPIERSRSKRADDQPEPRGKTA